MSRHHLFVLLFLFAALSPIQGQQTLQQSNSNQTAGPLEVLRNIDELLIKTKLEASQAGRNKEYIDQVNIAKSFVHALEIPKAEKAYKQAIVIAWRRGDHSFLMSAISRELHRLDTDKIKDDRPKGLDENYQVSSQANSKVEDPEIIDQFTAGAKIDAMLSFLYSDIIKTDADRLTLKGKLGDARHLLELGLIPEAEEAYHAAIIQFLDPRWTG